MTLWDVARPKYVKDSPVAPGILSAGLCGFLSIDVREKESLFVNLKAGGQYKFLKAIVHHIRCIYNLPRIKFYIAM